MIDAYTALSNQPDLFYDGLHPNADGAKVLAQTVAKAMKADKQKTAPEQ